MDIKFVFPVLAGASIVLQGALNRNSTNHLGLVSVVFLNALVFLCLSSIVWLLFKYNIIGNGFISAEHSFADLRWWQFLPGIFGFLIVFTTPLAIQYWGANSAFAIIICTQLVISLIWDSCVQRKMPAIFSLLGIIVMMGGLGLLILGNKK